MKVPVHVVGGFLGAGKTTTLRSLLSRLSPPGADAREQVAIVVNDFGEGAIEDDLVDALALTEIRGVCLCCTAPEGFVGAVAKLLDEVAPDRIFVEPVGLAHPADLVDTLRRAPFRDRIEVAPLVVVVDPHVLATSADPEIREQAALADVLVANRVDLASADELAAFERWAASLWPAPLAVVRTAHGEVPLDVLAWPEGAGPRAIPGAHDHDHDHDHDPSHGHVGRSWVWPPDTVFDRRRLHDALEAVAPRVSRLKGHVRTEQGVERLDIAGDRVHGRPSAWRRDSRIELLARDPGALVDADARLAAAIRRPEEARFADRQVELALPDGSTRVFDRDAIVALPDPVEDVGAVVPGREGAAARLSSLLAAVGAVGAREAVVVARDGYVTPPVAVDVLARGLLLHAIAGEPLAEGKGGPFRLLVPGEAGPCANVKGVVRIALR